MINNSKQSHYFIQHDTNLLSTNNCYKSQLNEQTTTAQRQKHLQRNNFHCELDIDDDYSFDNISELSKKSLKLMKILQKQQKQEMTAYGFKNEQHNIEQHQKPNLFQDDISSISYLAQQNTPLDSVWSKLMRPASQCQLSKADDGQFDDEVGEQCVGDDRDVDEQQRHEQCREQQFGECPNASSRIPLAAVPIISASHPQPLPLPHVTSFQSIPTYKATSLSFKTVNNYVKNYFMQKPSGIIIHPEYSTIIEDHSQLAVQGKALRMKVNYPQQKDKRKTHKVQVISQGRHQNFLKEVFGEQQQQISHNPIYPIQNKIQTNQPIYQHRK